MSEMLIFAFVISQLLLKWSSANFTTEKVEPRCIQWSITHDQYALPSVCFSQSAFGGGGLKWTEGKVDCGEGKV